MDKKEARIQMELLKLQRSRLQREIDGLYYLFCRSGGHYFKKLWEEAGAGLFKVSCLVCLLCGLRKIQKRQDDHCPVCCEPLKPPNSADDKNTSACSYCGYDGLSDVAAVPRKNIPKDDVLFGLILF